MTGMISSFSGYAKSPSRLSEGRSALTMRSMGSKDRAGKEVQPVVAEASPTDDGKAGLSTDLLYEHNEQHKMLVRARRQLWVWRVVSYILLAALIGKHTLTYSVKCIFV
jgi:hypothetical protein